MSRVHQPRVRLISPHLGLGMCPRRLRKVRHVHPPGVTTIAPVPAPLNDNLSRLTRVSCGCYKPENVDPDTPAGWMMGIVDG